jgi:PAS domain S-box-containing protein
MDHREQIIHELVEKGVFEAIGDGISIQDINYKVLYQNKVHINLVGSHVGEYCYNAYEKRKDRCNGCPLAETFKNGEIQTKERSAPTDKGTIYVEITTSPIKVTTGEIIAGIEVVRDITERKEIEEDLKTSEERYRTLFERNPYGIQEIDTSGTILYANKAHHDIYGYKEGSLIGRSITEFLVPGPQRDELPGYMAMVVKDQPPPTNYYQKVVTKQGLQKDIEVVWNYLRDTKGDVKGFISVLTDITESKKVEEAFKKSSFYLDSVNDTLIVINTEKEIIKVNKEFSTLWGYSPEEVLGKPVSIVFPEEEKPKHMSKMEEAVSTNKPLIFETIAFTKSGEKVPLSIRGSALFDKDGKLEGFIGVFRDITEHKNMEKALRKAHDELEKRVEERTTELEETNTALKVLLKQMVDDKKTFEEHILSNLKHLVMPYIGKLKKNRSMSKELSYLNIIEANLNEIVSPFSQKLCSEHLGFTPQELKIANLIKDGNQDKDISEILNISLEATFYHPFLHNLSSFSKLKLLL